MPFVKKRPFVPTVQLHTHAPAMADPVNEKETGYGEKKDDASTSIPVYDEQERGSIRQVTELHPQPTTDPLDPLNFSKAQKFTCLSIVMALYFLFTWITTVTVPSFTLLQDQYGISYAQVNWTVALPALGLMLGPLLWSSMADIYGRRMVFIVGTLIALVATIGAAVATDYSGYMVAR
jgi:Na+/melibiose symporter-like transporter